jgi:translation initiation factor 3 subunit F
MLFLGGDEPVYKIQPVVVFSILDHYKRRTETQDRVIGTLLGRISGNTTTITNCFPVPHVENEETANVDMDYHYNMLELHRRVNPDEIVVGWYSTGNRITYISSLMHDVYRNQVEFEPVHVTVDVELTNYRMGVKAYTGTTIRVGDKPVVGRFQSARLDFYAQEAERIGVDSLINGHPDEQKLDAPASILTDFENLGLSMDRILDMLETVSNYVSDVVDGKISGDVQVGRQIAAALSSIPKLDPTLLNNNIQDLLMIMYLSNVTRAQLAITDKAATLVR